MKKFIYQIYYNRETESKLLPGFLPLDNVENLRPDWFEFWVILNFLRNNDLEDNAWYGFLSPRFYEKTGFSSDYVLGNISSRGDEADVFLFSTGWDQLSYFLNPFEQGNLWHPGLLNVAQDFVDAYKLGINLNKLVSDTTSSVFSNYIIAQKKFWIKWKEIAEQFFEFIESDPKYQVTTSYGALENQFPMKIFVQERLASLILSTERFRVLSPDQSFAAPIFARLFVDDIRTRRLLQACDLMKAKYRDTSDEMYLDVYWKIREDIQFSSLSFE